MTSREAILSRGNENKKTLKSFVRLSHLQIYTLSINEIFNFIFVRLPTDSLNRPSTNLFIHSFIHSFLHSIYLISCNEIFASEIINMLQQTNVFLAFLHLCLPKVIKMQCFFKVFGLRCLLLFGSKTRT